MAGDLMTANVIAIRKVLIANRGEIAVRIARACRELGIVSVAVHSEIDAGAMHVRVCDEAVALGGSTAADSYLRIDALLNAAAASGADAVHPGYGFLSERADFAGAVVDAGLIFIGPSAAAMGVMGDKISSRIAAQAAGVSGVPGTNEPLGDDPDEVVRFGDIHGWPVAVKAAFGGGGRGMKVIANASGVAEAIAAARRESLAYFGRDELYVERYLDWARHVEVQVMADTHGNVVAVGDRDCSVQRRHQKVVEEAPAPSLTEAMRSEMAAAAVAVAREVGYVGAGTVEFIVQDGRFYFLEMNTRLQVEHPVTEQVTGLDLVIEQLRVAGGAPLSFAQADVVTRGHSIEVRINAEDPAGGRFTPSPGTLRKLQVAAGPGIRFDGGYESGDVVSPFYDNLIGKLVVTAPDRTLAIARLLRALADTFVDGVATTISAAQAVLAHPDFADVRHSTTWLERDVVLLDHPNVDVPFGVDAEVAGEDGVERSVVVVNGRSFVVPVFADEDASFGPVRRPTSTGVAAARPTAKREPRASVEGDGFVRAPMQGTIQKVYFAPGDAVVAEDVVAILEAMKMENQLRAGVAGRVVEVLISAGEQVGPGDVVMRIETN